MIAMIYWIHGLIEENFCAAKCQDSQWRGYGFCDGVGWHVSEWAGPYVSVPMVRLCNATPANAADSTTESLITL